MQKPYWHIEGYASPNKIFDEKATVDCFSEKQIQFLLMALTARASLNDEEIVGAYAIRSMEITNNLLTVNKDGPYQVYSCSTNPHFTAKVVRRPGGMIY